MSLLPGEKLHYAESHFKFKLPWSLLYRPWPEIILDAPFQFIPGSIPTLWIVVRDADRFPVQIKSLKIQIIGCSPLDFKKELIYENLDITANEAYAFYPIEIGALPPGTYRLYGSITVKNKDKVKTFSRWNLPGLKPKPLKIQVLEKDLPIGPGYVTGEMHCHTYYSTDHVEYGASPAVMQQAAKAIGLDFVNFTDHAYDFAFTREDYTKEASSPIPQFQSLKKELEQFPSTPLLMVGEEVSAGNSKNQNVHMTVLSPECYLPGLGDCGRNWLSNNPTLPIAKHLSMTMAPCFAAHPMQQMGALEKFVFKRGYWSSKDLHLDSPHPIRGIQFWNGIRDEGFMLGKSWWIEELGKEHYLLPIGGNDAHGDLNDTTCVHLPLLSLRHSRHHIFGKVRTAILIENFADGNSIPLKEELLKKAFDGDNCYITDGPALWWQRKKDTIVFSARSTTDLGGGFRYVRIYGRRRLANGKPAPQEEILPETQIATTQAVDITVYTSGFVYLRAECETASSRFAMTSAAKV